MSSTRLVEVGGVRLAVDDTGTGMPVVLLHGWPDSKEVWRHQVPALVADGYRVLALDLRGSGESDRPLDVEAYTGSHLVGDVLGVLDDSGIERAHLVGHDWGAAVAWILAAVHPSRVATLTALSVGHPAAFAAAGWVQRQKSWYVLLFQFRDVAEEWLRRDDFKNLRDWSRHPEVDAVVERLSRPGALTAGLNLYRAMAPPASLLGRSTLPSVGVPVMGVWSSQDLALAEQAMTASEGHVSGPWRYHRLDGVGHWMQLEAPEKVSALLLDFLGLHRQP
jgi:pimeloyl-ACP methyl ester carboxylesterase